MEEQSNNKKSGKKFTFRRLTVIGILLMLVGTLRLLFITTEQWFSEEEVQMSWRYSRLMNSIVTAGRQTKSLTADYDSWYLDRLSFLSYVSEMESPNYRRFMELGSRYMEDAELFLYNRIGGTLVEARGEPVKSEYITQILMQTMTGETEGCIDSEDNRYYYYCMDQDMMAVMRVGLNEYNSLLSNIYTPRDLIDRNMIDGQNFFFSAVDGVIDNYPGDEVEGMLVEDLLSVGKALPTTVFSQKSEFSFQIIQGRLMFVVCQHVEDTNMDLYYAVPFAALFSDYVYLVLPVVAAAVLLLILFVCYIRFLRIDYHKGRMEGEGRESTITYKASVFAAASLLIVTGIAYYVKTLNGLSYFIENYRDTAESVRYMIEENEKAVSNIQNEFDRQELRDAEMISKYLSDFPERRTSDDLGIISSRMGMNYIMMFDTNGKETVTDSDYAGYSISTDKDNPSYIFNPLKNGVPSVVGPLQQNDLTKETDQLIGVTTKDSTGHVDGFLLSSVNQESLQEALKTSSLTNMFDNSAVTNALTCYLINTETKEFTYAEDHGLIGKKAADYGFTENVLRGDFSGYFNGVNERLYGHAFAIDNNLLYVTVPVEPLFAGRTGYTLNAAAIMAVMLAVLAFLERLIPVEDTELQDRREEHKHEKHSGQVYILHPENVSSLSLRHRLRVLRRKWPNMTAEEKIGKFIYVLLVVTSVAATVMMIFRNQLFGSGSVLAYIFSGNWPFGLNIFSVSAVAILIIAAVVFGTIITELLDLLSKTLTAKAETICHMIRSFFEYGLAIMTAYMGFSFFGVDVRALTATVGFLSLMIGFGARSLITDIVAGLFIIFEQEFQVGDIVEVGGYRGMVKEIGLRTTKLISWDKNIKIINNHDINNVINLTMCSSFANVNFTIPVTTSIDDVEAVFNEELPKLKEKYPQIIGEPYFTGILQFSGGKMSCRISAEVNELERGELEDNLHREVQSILKSHEIQFS